MDREPEELQFLGFFGIFRESYKILLSSKKLFTQITLSLILPLSFIFLSHIQVQDLIFTKISTEEEALDNTQLGSPTQTQILNSLSSAWTAFILFKAAYLLVVLVFSLLSTSAVVYTIACIYSAKDVSFNKVMSVVPKVWKRLMVTFLWNFIILLIYNTLTIPILILILVLVSGSAAGIALLVLLLVCYLIGLVYISVVWQLASVVSVLENVYGLAAMRKSRVLIRGNLWSASAVFVVLDVGYVAIQILFGLWVVNGSVGLGARVVYGVVFFVLLSALILIGLVTQTAIYLVCKSHHHENIDKSCLADHLEVYLGEYVPLQGKAVQLEEF